MSRNITANINQINSDINAPILFLQGTDSSVEFFNMDSFTEDDIDEGVRQAVKVLAPLVTGGIAGATLAHKQNKDRGYDTKVPGTRAVNAVKGAIKNTGKWLEQEKDAVEGNYEGIRKKTGYKKQD